MTIDIDDFGQPSRASYLKRFSVSKLFGYKSIELNLESPVSSDERPINIVYGNNGSGKTTALKLIYFILSPQDGRSYKSWVARLPFSKAVFEFSDNTKLEVVKESLVGSYEAIYRYGRKSKRFKIIYKDGGVKRNYEGTEVVEFLEFLDKLPMDLFYISDRRQYFTTSSHINQSTPRIVRRRSTSGDVEILSDEYESEEKSITISAMSDIITDVFRRRVLRVGASSQRNTNHIYKGLVQSVLDTNSDGESKIDRNILVSKITKTEELVDSAVKIGAMPSFDAVFYRQAVTSASEDAIEKLNFIILPFLNSLDARASAISPVIERMESLVAELNRFYEDKIFTFSISKGFAIQSRSSSGPVEFEWLSSGERQLFIILSSVFLTYEASGVVLIDEPELSLNIIWQREFVRALQRITKGSAVQYILASHSPEILSSEAAHVISAGV